MIKELCAKLGIPQDSAQYLEECLLKILADKTCASLLLQGEESLFEGDFRHDEMLEEISSLSGIHRYTVNLVFVLYCARSLFYVYCGQGLSDKLFYETMHDLACKHRECVTVYGIDGIFTLKWYNRFFLCKLFAIGRLQYGVNEYIYDDWRGVLKRGDIVFDCHIPSTGEPLTPDAVEDSMKRAYKFFKERGELRDDVMTIICHSYLLYPGTLHLFPENGNVRAFAKLFDPVAPHEEPENPNFWRIFGKQYDEKRGFEGIELNTTLRRNFAEYISRGGKMGLTYGVLRFDGKKVLD